MGNRFWVGGTDTWDGNAYNHWSLTSGGAGGEAVPTNADDVFLDAASGAVTVTVGSSVACKSLTCTGFTGTLTGTDKTITVSGNITLVAGMTLSGTLTLKTASTSSVTTAGKTIYIFLPDQADNNNHTTVTMVDALNCGTLVAERNMTLLLKSGVTSTITALTDNSTAAKPFTLGATTTSAATLSCASGTVSLVNATISYSTATGGATFTAGPGATDGGNNTGWNFLSSGITFFELGAF